MPVAYIALGEIGVGDGGFKRKLPSQPADVQGPGSMTVAGNKVRRPGRVTQQESRRLRPQLMKKDGCPSLTVQGRRSLRVGETPRTRTPAQVSLRVGLL